MYGDFSGSAWLFLNTLLQLRTDGGAAGGASEGASGGAPESKRRRAEPEGPALGGAFNSQRWCREFEADGADKRVMRREIAQQTLSACREYGYMHHSAGWTRLPKDFMLAMSQGTVNYRHSSPALGRSERDWVTLGTPTRIEVVNPFVVSLPVSTARLL